MKYQLLGYAILGFTYTVGLALLSIWLRKLTPRLHFALFAPLDVIARRSNLRWLASLANRRLW